MTIQVLHELHLRSELGGELRDLRTEAALSKDVYDKTLESLDRAARPPQRYVAEGACPFECCS